MILLLGVTRSTCKWCKNSVYFIYFRISLFKPYDYMLPSSPKNGLSGNVSWIFGSLIFAGGHRAPWMTLNDLKNILFLTIVFSDMEFCLYELEKNWGGWRHWVLVVFDPVFYDIGPNCDWSRWWHRIF